MTKTTLKQFLQSHTKDTSLTQIIVSLTEVCKEIAEQLRTAPLDSIHGATQNINTSGDIQQKLDVLANDQIRKSLESIQEVHALVSEELPDADILHEAGEYNIYTDPLDGSSNIDINWTTGTIFGIAKSGTEYLIPGERLDVAGYVLYSSACELVLTLGNGVASFILDKGEFLLTRTNILIPEDGRYYSVNESKSADFDDKSLALLAQLKAEGKSLRYSGALVSDIHRVLLKGGVHFYPRTKSHPEGKLRLLYEINPIAKIVEEAGGRAY